MYRYLVLFCLFIMSFGASADICSQLYNEKGVAFHYEVLGKSYSLKGYERSQIFVNGLDYHYRLLGGSLHVGPEGISSDWPGRFSYYVSELSGHSKRHCSVVYLISISH